MQVIKRAGYKTRGSFYTHIANPELSFEILEKYARALNVDFSMHFPEMAKYIIQDPGQSYSVKPKSMEEAIEQRDVWKEKYFELLEKFMLLIEREGLIK